MLQNPLCKGRQALQDHQDHLARQASEAREGQTESLDHLAHQVMLALKDRLGLRDRRKWLLLAMLRSRQQEARLLRHGH